MGFNKGHQLTRKAIKYHVDGKGCWVCTSHCLNNGYPKYVHKGVSTHMSRAIYEQHYNCSILNGYMVRHRCDNRACINPLHLELGDNQDNMDDMKSRGRSPKNNGENNPNSKLTWADIHKIRTAVNVTGRELALIFNITEGAISKIKTNRTWTGGQL